VESTLDRRGRGGAAALCQPESILTNIGPKNQFFPDKSGRAGRADGKEGGGKKGSWVSMELLRVSDLSTWFNTARASSFSLSASAYQGVLYFRALVIECSVVPVSQCLGLLSPIPMHASILAYASIRVRAHTQTQHHMQTWMGRVTHVDGSCQTCGWVMSRHTCVCVVLCR